jgi:hypothetical protein
LTAKRNPIDSRPFRSKAAILREEELEAKYRGVAIPGLAAALAAPRAEEEQARIRMTAGSR